MTHNEYICKKIEEKDNFVGRKKMIKKVPSEMINRIKDSNITNLQTFLYFTNLNFQLKM